MSIVSDIIRGHTDSIILASLMEKDSYGYEINKKIKYCSDGMYELNEATLYTAFKRLEDNGYITSYWGNEATNARRKYYRITKLGEECYYRLMDEWQTSKKIVDRLLSSEGKK